MVLSYISALIVDDEPVNVLFAQRLLAADGWRVRTATDGADGVRLLEEEPADLVIMDLLMPVMDGIEAVGRIRRSAHGAAGAPILAWTTLSMAPAMLQHHGFDGKLPKPCTAETLVAEVRRWAPTSDDALDRLEAVFDPAEIIALHARLRLQLTEAMAGTDTIATAHRIAGAAGTLGFAEVSASWLRLAEGDRSAWDEARHAARCAIATIDRRARLPNGHISPPADERG